MQILKTERLILREFTPGDGAFILRLLNSPGWIQFIGDRGIKTLDEAVAFISEKLTKSYQTLGFGFYLVMLKTDKTPIGMCGLIKRDFLENVDIGYALLPEYEGKGYAFEITSATMNYAKEKLNIEHISAICNEDNNRSIELLKKIGLQFKKKIKIPTESKELLLFEN